MKERQQYTQRPVCLAIGGFDPSGGAGLIVDVKAFTAFNCSAAAAVTSITFQNSKGISGTSHQTANELRGQINAVAKDLTIAAVKTGMLPTAEIVEETARLVAENSFSNIVVDPVIRSSSGYDLMDDGAIGSLVRHLFPLADLITPNIPEAERLTGISIETESDIENAAKILTEMGARNVLIKGGHFHGDQNVRGNLIHGKMARDFLFAGNELTVFEAEFSEEKSMRGTGCTLASSIAANLAVGNDLATSISVAKKFVTESIRSTAKNSKKIG